MKKETLKTITLVLLVLSSIILTINNWFSEKLWPDGYNFFSNLVNYFSDEEEPRTYYLSKENIANPTKIIVNNNEYKCPYTHTSDDFNDMVNPIKEILKSGLKSRNHSKTNGSAWEQALVSRSIYISYPVAYGSKTFSAIMDTPVNAVPDGYLKEFIIVSGDSITGKPHLLIKNASDNSYTDVTLEMGSEEIDRTIETYASDIAGGYRYSGELMFFDKSDTDQKIFIEPQVLMPLDPSSFPTVTEINYFADISENQELCTAFLQGFGFNTSNIRKYVNTDNSVVFAENYGTIKMYPDGLLEYRALDDTKGISIGNSTEFYDSFIGTIEFVNNIWDKACYNCNMNINLSSAKITDSDNSFKLSIDYFANGMEVVSKLKGDDLREGLGHAIEIEVKNSKVVSYRQIVKGYRANDSIVECMTAIEALDAIMANESIKSDTITDLYLAYCHDKQRVYMPCWVARTAMDEITIIENN